VEAGKEEYQQKNTSSMCLVREAKPEVTPNHPVLLSESERHEGAADIPHPPCPNGSTGLKAKGDMEDGSSLRKM
jgi:hypothetical protein